MAKREDELKQLNDKIELLSSHLSASSNNLSNQQTELSRSLQDLADSFKQYQLESDIQSSKTFAYGIVIAALAGGLFGILNSDIFEIYQFLHFPIYLYLTQIVVVVPFLGYLIYTLRKMAKLPIKKVVAN